MNPTIGPKTTKELKVGEQAILRTYAGPVRVTVKKVTAKYLYVTRTDSRFCRETGACLEVASKRLETFVQQEEAAAMVSRLSSLERWGVGLVKPYTPEKVRKVYEALKDVLGSEHPDGQGLS